MSEQIEHKGIVYAVTEIGLVSDRYRQKNREFNKWDIETLPAEAEISNCIEWLKRYASPAKTPNRRIGSYGLKHLVEKWAGTYISNGAFILAAQRLGYQIIPEGALSPNALFCMSIPKEALQL